MYTRTLIYALSLPPCYYYSHAQHRYMQNGELGIWLSFDYILFQLARTRFFGRSQQLIIASGKSARVSWFRNLIKIIIIHMQNTLWFSCQSDFALISHRRTLITIMLSLVGRIYFYVSDSRCAKHSQSAACHARLLRRSGAFRGASALCAPACNTRMASQPTCVLSAEPRISLSFNLTPAHGHWTHHAL